MNYGLYMSAAGAETQNKRVQVLSNNLANVDTTGFRPDFAIMKARSAEEIERGLSAPGTGSKNDIGGGVDVFETRISSEAGKFKTTRSKTDLAIVADDTYFVVEKDGEQLLTRAGDFNFDREGVLRTSDGQPVLAESGLPLQLADPSGGFQVNDREGSITQGDSKQQLMLRRPAQPGDLIKAGGNRLRPLTETLDVDPGKRGVRSGALEMSAVKPTSAMVNLIAATRAYEANIQMIQHQDSTLGNLLGRVLRQS